MFSLVSVFLNCPVATQNGWIMSIELVYADVHSEIQYHHRWWYKPSDSVVGKVSFLTVLGMMSQRWQKSRIISSYSMDFIDGTSEF